MRRTQFEGGEVAQKRISSRVYDVRSFTIAVKLSNHIAFREWLRDSDGKLFNFVDLQDADPAVSRDVQIQGGAGSVNLVWAGANALLGDEQYFTGEVTLEGYW